MTGESIDIRLRLLEARAFQTEANAAARSTRGIGDASKYAGRHAGGAVGHVTRLRGGMAALGRVAKIAAIALAGMATAAAGLGFAFAKKAVTSTWELFRATSALSRQTGLDVKTASTWIETMKVRGVEANMLTMAFQSLSKNLTSAHDGSKKLVARFKELGVSQRMIAGGNFQVVVLRIADAFSRMHNATRRTALAVRLFGKGGASLISILSRGRAGVLDALAATQRYGAYLNKSSFGTFQKARDAQMQLNLAMDGMRIQLADKIMPVLVPLLQRFATFIGQMASGKGAAGEFSRSLSKLSKNVAIFVKGVVDGTGKGGKFVTEVKQIISYVTPLALSFVHLTNSMTAVAEQAVKFISKTPGLKQLAVALVSVGVAFKTLTAIGNITGITALAKTNLGQRLVGSIVGPLKGLGAKAAGAVSEFGVWLATRLRLIGGVAGTGMGNAATVKGVATMEASKGRWAALGGRLGKVAGAAIGAAILLDLPNIMQQVGDALGLGPGWKHEAKRGYKDLGGLLTPESGGASSDTIPKGGLSKWKLIGGKWVHKQHGGLIGPLGTDTVPAMLTPGEFVVRQRAVQKVGVPKLEAINRGDAGGGEVHIHLDVDGEELAHVVAKHPRPLAHAVGREVARKSARR